MSEKNRRLLLIVTEGPTDEEFYKKVIDYTKKKNNCPRFNFDSIKYMCACGIGNMHKKILAKFKIEICQNTDYYEYEKVVCFCYDLDVFKSFVSNPPIDRDQMKEDFKKCGANKIIEIIADNMIEDFFLYDINGIRKFLKLKKTYKNSKKKSLELLKQMYKDSNRIYTKGTKAEGLVEALDMNLILSNICNQVSVLCDELGYYCNKNKCV